jgi:spore maturation protein CgeB
VPDAALASTLAGGQVALGCSETTGPSRARMMRLRDFEAPLAGACYLTQRSAGLDRCFRVGEEVLAWDGTADLVETARRLLADPARCLAVARAGWERARRDHTYAARLETLFGLLGIRRPA